MGYNDPIPTTILETNRDINRLGNTPIDYSKLLPFYAALAKRNSARCTIAMIGDSISEGAYSTDFQNNSTPGRLTSLLRSQFPTTGVAQGRGWIPASNFAPGPNNPPVTVSGTSSLTQSDWSPNNQLIPMSQATHFVTVTLAGTSFDLNYVTFSGAGVGYYQIDAGAQVTFNTNSNPAVPNVKLNVALTAGNHTIKVGWSSGGAVYFNGFTEYNQDEAAGINVARFALSGSSTFEWLAAAHLPVSTASFSPSLIIIQYGVNDARIDSHGATSNTFGNNISTMIANLQAQFTTPVPIILSMCYQAGLNFKEPWGNYVAVANNIAATNLAIVIDHSARMPIANAAQTYGLYNGDAIHPSDGGYSFMANTLAAAIAPR